LWKQGPPRKGSIGRKAPRARVTSQSSRKSSGRCPLARCLEQAASLAASLKGAGSGGSPNKRSSVSGPKRDGSTSLSPTSQQSADEKVSPYHLSSSRGSRHEVLGSVGHGVTRCSNGRRASGGSLDIAGFERTRSARSSPWHERGQLGRREAEKRSRSRDTAPSHRSVAHPTPRKRHRPGLARTAVKERCESGATRRATGLRGSTVRKVVLADRMNLADVDERRSSSSPAATHLAGTAGRKPGVGQTTTGAA
jgi:hypothetical protein